jgi:signal transduction histidine kinase
MVIKMLKYKYIRVKLRPAEREAHYQLLLEKMFNGFFVAKPLTDDQGELVDFRFIDCNPALERQLNLSRQDICGKTWLEIVHHPNPHLNIVRKVWKTGQSQQFEAYDSVKDRYFIINVFKIEHQLGFISEEVTAYRKGIQEVELLNQEVEARVNERTADLQRVVYELESFTHTVAHDLKAPLRAITSYSRFIQEDYGAELNADLAQMVANISDIGNNAIALIDRLLEYCKTTTQEITWEDIDLQALITEVFNKLKSMAAERVLELNFETALPPIRADRILLNEVIYNVLTNSFKFCRQRDKTVITVGCRIGVGEYQVYIRDNGVGFDMEYAGKLFGIFERLHTQEEFEGTGIGLATVKKIMERHGGRAWIKGRLNEGAIVYLGFPVG